MGLAKREIMTDAFLLGAGFSKAIASSMPAMTELYDDLKQLVHLKDGITNEEYDYAADNVESLLTHFAIRSPHDDDVEALRKQRITILIEHTIGDDIRQTEDLAASEGLNPRGNNLILKWHEDRSHVLTTNYDTIVERIADGSEHSLEADMLYPVPITPAHSRDGMARWGSGSKDTFTLYKLHGSTSWYKSNTDVTFDPIYSLSPDQFGRPNLEKFIADKRRFIVPPVYDKSTLLNHESIRALWIQAKQRALWPADRLYIIGYSLPETDTAMRSLLWAGSKSSQITNHQKKSLFVVDRCAKIAQRYADALGCYYDVIRDYAGGEDAFDRFVEDYTAGM